MSILTTKWKDYFEKNGFEAQETNKNRSEYKLFLPQLNTRISIRVDRGGGLTDEEIGNYYKIGKYKNTLVLLGKKLDRHNWYYFGEDEGNPFDYIPSLD